MKRFRTIKVVFGIKSMDGIFSETVDVFEGKSVEKAIQKKFGTKREINIQQLEVTHTGEIG